MKELNELKSIVLKKGYGTALYGNVNGEPVYLSRGIRELFLGEEDIQHVIDAVIHFQNEDFGDAASYGKASSKGHEYGRYAIAPLTGEDGEDTAVWVHRDNEAILVYFRFER